MRGDDTELRARFQELRAHDARLAPPFEAPAATRPTAIVLRRTRWIGLAAAAVLALIVIGVATFVITEPVRRAPDLDAWRAPTDALLDQAAPALFGEPMPISASVVDRFIPETSVFNGD